MRIVQNSLGGEKTTNFVSKQSHTHSLFGRKTTEKSTGDAPASDMVGKTEDGITWQAF